MSLHAHKIEKISDKISFSMNNDLVFDYLEKHADWFWSVGTDVGYVSVSVEHLRYLVDNAEEFGLDELEVKQMKEDIKDLDVDDYVDYSCW